jgi:hypothetical protein
MNSEELVKDASSDIDAVKKSLDEHEGEVVKAEEAIKKIEDTK